MKPKLLKSLLAIALILFGASCTDYDRLEALEDSIKNLENEANNETAKSIILWENEVELNYQEEVKIEFRVNPSNAKFQFDSDINKSEILLDIVTKNSNSYVTNPDKYILQNVEVLRDSLGNKLQGHYIATIKDLGKMQPYNDNIALVIKQKGTEEYLISSNIIKISYKQNLPIIVIITPNNTEINSKETWVSNTQIKIVNTDGSLDYFGENDNIRGRGNTTWEYPKKPYAIKLDKKSAILGMPKHKRWVLLANWMDRTLLRNHVAFEISRRIGLDYTPRGTFVEVILNDKKLGNYYLCEQIKIDENRLNITEMESTDIEGSALTGGYLLEIDDYFDEINKFRSSTKQYPVNIKEPDEDVLNSVQFDYIKNYFSQIEEILYENKQGDIGEYIDYESFAQWFILYELTGSYEPNNPKSCYMHKDRDEKLKAGPAWDFDWGTFTPGKYMFRISKALYYDKLLEDKEFVRVLKECWSKSKSELNKMDVFIRNSATEVKESADKNFEMWPIDNDKNGDELMEYNEAIERLIDSFYNNMDVIEKCISEL